MNKYLLIVLLSASGYVIGQNYTDSLCRKSKSAEGISFNKLGVATIYLKDGTLTKNCAIKEIKPLWVVYQKNRTLHDILIEKIDCIVPLDENFVLWFNEKKVAVISKECRVDDK